MIDKYFEPIQVQRFVTTTNAWGEEVKEWQDYAVIMARIRPLTGNQRLTADKHTYFASHRLYCKGTVELDDTFIIESDIPLTGEMTYAITNEDRFLYRGKNYKINFVADVMNFARLLQIDLEIVE